VLLSQRLCIVGFLIRRSTGSAQRADLVTCTKATRITGGLSCVLRIPMVKDLWWNRLILRRDLDHGWRLCAPSCRA